MKHLWVIFVWLPLYAAGTVPNRYFVELDTEPVAVHVGRAARGGRMAALRSAEARQHRARIRAEQQQARSGVEAEGATVLEGMDTVANALVVQAPDAARLERVRRRAPGGARVPRPQDARPRRAARTRPRRRGARWEWTTPARASRSPLSTAASTSPTPASRTPRSPCPRASRRRAPPRTWRTPTAR